MKKFACSVLMLTCVAKAEVFSTPAAPETSPLPWLSATSPTTAELGQIKRPDDTLLATISGGWTRDHLTLRILVNDPDHVPAPDERRLWSADSIEIGIDAAGDGSGSLPSTTTGPIGNDDFKFIFGLLDSGPGVNVLASQTKPDLDVLREGTCVSRTTEGQTLYELSLPWSLLNLTGGSRPTLGLDLQVNDRNPGQAENVSYNWGHGLQGAFTAANFHPFVLGAPESAFAALDWSDAFSWDGQSPLILHVGLRSEQDAKIQLILGGVPSTITVPGGPGLQVRELSLPAQGDGSDLSAQVLDQTPVLARQAVASTVYQELQSRLATLVDRPGQHPLFVRHLRSLSALAATDWGRVQLLRTSDPRRARASISHYQDLLGGLNADAADWEAYLDGRRSLVMAYVSPQDQSTQFYLFGLPRDWDPDRAYPLFFELHGAGNNHPMAGIADRLAAKAKRQDGFGYESPKVYAEIERSGFWVHPFGRGNLGYEGIARIDVLEAYDDVHRLVPIDPNRRYLYGFSMGGQGTFTLGARTPDRWAAACSIAPGLREGSADAPPIANWTLLPYKLIAGEEDRLFKFYGEILDALGRHGIHPEARSIPGLGHQYLYELQKEMIDWLKTHVRERPDSFTFVTDDNLTNTCWGVTLHLPTGASAVARVTCQRDGQTIRLETEGTSRLFLDPSEPDGLGLSGTITVLWNGAQAYHGPARPITLPQP